MCISIKKQRRRKTGYQLPFIIVLLNDFCVIHRLVGFADVDVIIVVVVVANHQLVVSQFKVLIRRRCP